MVNSPSLNTRYLLLFWRLFIPIIIAIVKNKQQSALAADALCKYNRNEKILPINITGMNLSIKIKKGFRLNRIFRSVIYVHQVKYLIVAATFAAALITFAAVFTPA